MHASNITTLSVSLDLRTLSRPNICKIALLGTNISPEKSIMKMIFLFPRWDMLISWRVYLFFILKFEKLQLMLLLFDGNQKYQLREGQVVEIPSIYRVLITSQVVPHQQ